MRHPTQDEIIAYNKMKSTKSKKSARGKHKNPWIAHLSAFRKAHPDMNMKSAMKAAKKTYKKV